MDRPPDLMQPPANPSDPRATVVHTTGDTMALPGIPGYRVVKKLGQGGMATVYMATQIALDRPVSIKVMERDALADETSMQRFENETRTIAKLSHPSIVAIYEVGRTDDGRMYYSMPFLPNGDLAQRNLDSDDARIVDLLRTLLSALDYAHARGIVHRDVKQENVLFDGDNRPLLADFGIAMSKNDDVRITTAGFAVGSAPYMAPEQARGDAVDGRADLYSVGVLTYELLTGKLPFSSTDAFALALMHAQKDIPRLPPAKRHWQAFIDKAMAKAPEQRFATAKEMLDALERIGRRSGNQVSRRVMRSIDRTVPASRMKRVGLIGLASAVVLAGGMYAMRDHLPTLGAASTGTAPPTAAASPANPATATAAPATPSDASGAPVSTTFNPASTAAGSPAAASSAAAPSTTVPSATTPSTTAPSNPAPSTTGSPAPPAPPQTPAVPAPTSAAASVALANARTELDRGNLVQPAGKNAVDLALAAWELAPGSPDGRTLIGDVLRSMSVEETQAIAQHNDQRAAALDKKAVMLDNATVGTSASAWKSLRASATHALLARAKNESADSAALARSQALADQFGVKLASTTSPATAPSPAPSTSQPAAVPQPSVASIGIDAGFVKLHGPIGLYPPAAIALTEVTRHDYAVFVAATSHVSSECSSVERGAQATQGDYPRAARYGSGERANRGRFGWNRQQNAAATPATLGPTRVWNAPGYVQAGDHPVVCVSWNDAIAYTQWLGQRNGHRYRLPSAGEWRLAIASGVGGTSAGGGTVPARSGSPNALGLYGLDGNVSEWLADCAFGCERHQVAGRSWRNRGNDQTTGGRLADRGFDDVGFRVVQVLAAGSRDGRAAGR